MKKNFFAAILVAMVMTVSANAQFSGFNRFGFRYQQRTATAVEIVNSLTPAVAEKFIPLYQKYIVEIENVTKSELSIAQKEAKINSLKGIYSDKFCYLLDSEQTARVINDIPYRYIVKRTK